MNDLDSPKTKPQPPKSRALGVALTILIASLIIAGIGLWPRFISKTDHAHSELDALRERLGIVEERADALDGQVKNLNAQFEKIAIVQLPQAQLPAQAGPAAPSPAASDIAHMQSDLVSLSAAVSALQAEMKQTGAGIAQIQQTAQDSLSQAIAFIRLQEVAQTGHGFTQAWQAMQNAAKNNSTLQGLLTKMQPYAEKGAPTSTALQNEFADLRPSVLHALAKANAQNWWQRLAAEFQGLITVRSLENGTAHEDALSAIDTDLAQGDLMSALAAIQNLPPAAREALSDFRAQVEARQTIDGALDAIGDQLMASLAKPAPTPQGAP